MMLIISSIFLGSYCSVFASEELIRAALDNNVERVRQLLDEGADIDYLDEDEGITALMYSSCMGNLEMARFLMQRKAEMGFTDDYVQKVLHMAILQGQAETADMLWEMNERKMSRSREGNLLHMCCVRESPKMLAFMRKILETGVKLEELNEEDDWRYSPLLRALKEENMEAARLLIDKGCDIHVKGENERTALHLASASCRKDFTSLVHIFLKSGVELEAKDCRKETALHVALRDGSMQTVELLMKANANVWIDAFRGSNALHLAAVREGFEKITKKLLEKGVDVKKRSQNGNTCLHEALLSGSLETVELLLPYDVDFKALGERRQNTLHLAACRMDTAHVVEFLVRKGVHIDAKDAWGNTPLHNALKRGYDQVTRKLLELGADFRLLGNGNVSPLAMASGWGKFYDVVKMILESGFDPDTSDEDGETALHAAADLGCVKIIDLLLSFGASINVISTLGEDTPLTAAAKNYVECRETIRFIIDNGGRIASTTSPIVLFIQMAILRPEKAKIFLEEYPETEFYDGLLEKLVKYSIFGVPIVQLGLNGIANRKLQVQGLVPIIINNGANITNGKETLRMFAKEILYKKPTCSETFPEFLAAAIKKRIQSSGDGNNIVELYSKWEIFALYRSIKKWYEEILGEKGEIECRAYDVALKKRQWRYYDEIIMVMTKGTYMYALPNDLASDVIQDFHCYFLREISKLSWILPLVEATTTEKITDENGHFIKPELIKRHFENITL